MNFKELCKLIENNEFDSPPIHAGTYKLLRGSHNGNQNPSLGLYAYGIHYSTDISTCQEFGSHIDEYSVTLKKPFVTRTISPNPIKNTKTLLSKGYDSLVISHKKTLYKIYKRLWRTFRNSFIL